MIWAICENNGVDENANLVFKRDKSALKMEVGPPTRGNRPTNLVVQTRTSTLQGRAPVISLFRDGGRISFVMLLLRYTSKLNGRRVETRLNPDRIAQASSSYGQSCQ
jgi:hypothetical protein